MTPETGGASTASGQSWLWGILLGVAALAIIAAIAKTVDMRRKREDDAVHLQAQIADALLRDRMLASLPVIAAVHIPIWRKNPAIVKMQGQVPTAELRQAVLHVAAQETAKLLESYHLEDSITVVQTTAARAA
jgi:predicted outer membrane lipoprotein